MPRNKFPTPPIPMQQQAARASRPNATETRYFTQNKPASTGRVSNPVTAYKARSNVVTSVTPPPPRSSRRGYTPYGAEPTGGLMPEVKPGIPTTNAQAWDRYALDKKEVMRLWDLQGGQSRGNQAVQEITNWRDIHLRPEDRAVAEPGSATAGTNPNADGSGGYGNGGYGGGGYGGGGGEEAQEEVPITWSEFDSKVSNAPTWWKALKPSAVNPATEYLSQMNMMIPFMSPEDQRSTAANIYQQDPVNFAHLNPEKLDGGGVPFAPPNAMTTGLRQQFNSAQRGTNALSALTNLAASLGKTDAELGSGYRYLRSILDTTQRYGGANAQNQQTRRQYMDQQGSLDPLLASAKQDELSAYGPLARMLSQPYFTAGMLTPLQRTQDGRYTFGEANKELL